MTTTSPSTPAVPPGPRRPDRAERRRAVADRALSNRITAALIAYLETVAAALNRRGVAVAGVANTTADLGMVSGRIQLAQQRTRSHDLRGALQLRWTETTGWEVALRPTPEDAVTPGDSCTPT